jgi:predicted DNA-binding protein
VTKKILRSIYLDPETVEALDERALVESKTKAELVRTFIEQGLDRAAATVGEQAIDEAAVDQEQLVATVQALIDQVQTADKANQARFEALEQKLTAYVNVQGFKRFKTIAAVQLGPSNAEVLVRGPTGRPTERTEPRVAGPLLKKR